MSLALILILALPASAATSLTGYSLIAGGKRVALSSSTGYIGKSGSRLTVPLKTVCDAAVNQLFRLRRRKAPVRGRPEQGSASRLPPATRTRGSIIRRSRCSSRRMSGTGS